jgi:osmotically-inducible protein OsmY
MPSRRIMNHESRIRGVAIAALVALLLPGCAAKTQVQKAGADQDIARDVSWELRKNPRLADVNALCSDGVVTLLGRVDSKAVEADAVKSAESSSHGSKVVSKLDIRPR